MAQLVTTDEDVARAFMKVVGVGSIHCEAPRQAHHKPKWCWKVTKRADFAKFTQMIEPWLGQRRRARLAEVRALDAQTRRKPGPKEKCRNGHLLTAENRKPNGNGKVACRECARERDRRRYARSAETVVMHDA